MKNTPKFKIDNNKLARLVAKAQHNDQKAAEEVVNMVSGYIYYYSLSLLGDEDKARDAVQDILLNMLKKLSTLEDPKAFLGWLKVMTSNYCKTKLSREKEALSIDDGTWELEDSSDQVSPQKAAETSEVCAVVREAVSALPVSLRESVLMFYFQQMSVRQIAETLEVNENTVKSRLFSARKNMKQYLERYGGAALASCAIPPMSLISFSLIQGAERQKSILLPYTTPAGAVKVAAINPAAAAGGTAMRIAAIGAACLLAAGGVGAAASSGAFTPEPSDRQVSAAHGRSANADYVFSDSTEPDTTVRFAERADTERTGDAQPATAVQSTVAPKNNTPGNAPTVTTATAPYQAPTEARSNTAAPATQATSPTAAPATEAKAEDTNSPKWKQRSDGKIYFYADPKYWNELSTVYVYLYEHNGGALIDWGKKKAAMTDEGGGIWSYAPAQNGIQLSSGKQYGAIFSADWKEQTADLILGTPCLGDLAYMCGEYTKAPAEGNKSPDDIRWVNQSAGAYARPKTVSSLGVVEGDAFWQGESAESLLKGFITGAQFNTAARMTGRTKRQCAYDTGAQLGLSSAQVDAVAKSAGVDLE